MCKYYFFVYFIILYNMTHDYIMTNINFSKIFIRTLGTQFLYFDDT